MLFVFGGRLDRAIISHQHERTQVAAALLVVGFIKRKLVAKSEMTVSKAEEFLASLLKGDYGLSHFPSVLTNFR